MLLSYALASRSLNLIVQRSRTRKFQFIKINLYACTVNRPWMETILLKTTSNLRERLSEAYDGCLVLHFNEIKVSQSPFRRNNV